LARTGIYAHSRNPSVFGKLFGVLSVGFALNSASFCFILVPLLLAGSLVEKVVRQEPQLVEVFGEEYERYRKEVPLFIPWKLLVPSRFLSS
jgi:protein-S-isoprenylcysteine O-methyltransferase Ste14